MLQVPRVRPAPDNMIECFKSTWHLQADKVMANAVDHRRHSIDSGALGRFSCAIALARLVEVHTLANEVRIFEDDALGGTS